MSVNEFYYLSQFRSFSCFVCKKYIEKTAEIENIEGSKLQWRSPYIQCVEILNIKVVPKLIDQDHETNDDKK